ncbi:MAG: AAA domain-containing protein [candidate division WOR-3 bacterium]
MLDRTEHIKLLDLELKTQSDNYLKLVLQNATALIEQEEVFTSQFVKFEDGILLLKFKTERALPRKGQYLTAVLLSDEKRSYKNWGDLSWAELRKQYQVSFTECVCVWHRAYVEKGFQLAGFKGVSLDFASKLVDKCLVTLGPHEPPLRYLQNLIDIVANTPKNTPSARFLDIQLVNNEWLPTILDEKRNLSDFIQTQLSISDEIIIQGPPGTGKTYQMAKLIADLLDKNKSILATSLTNRSLVELASKKFLENHRKNGKIYKTNLTKDEQEELPGIINAKDIQVISGTLLLSTFYYSSGFATQINKVPPFDYVVIDEASQALLAMFCAAKKLGKKVAFIGDPYQLPPVVELNMDKIEKRNAICFVEGFNTICRNLSIPSFQLTETYRLPVRAAKYTSIFYNNKLVSKAKLLRFQFPECGLELNKYLNPEGGPVLIKSSFPIGNDAPEFGLFLIINFLKQLRSISEKEFNIAIISKTKKAVRAIQKAVTATFGSADRILIETVERIQGLTCDLTIFFIPNSSMNYSLKKALFNVATSRATRHTIIIADKAITTYPIADKLVRDFIEKLNDEFSFEMEPKKNMKRLTEG